jgi:hypothetical protein
VNQVVDVCQVAGARKLPSPTWARSFSRTLRNVRATPGAADWGTTRLQSSFRNYTYEQAVTAPFFHTEQVQDK